MVAIKTFIDEMLGIVYLFYVCSINWLFSINWDFENNRSIDWLFGENAQRYKQLAM